MSGPAFGGASSASPSSAGGRELCDAGDFEPGGVGLAELAPPTPKEKSAGTFSADRIGISVDNYLSDRLRKSKTTVARKRQDSKADCRSVASGHVLVGRPLCHHAGSHPFILWSQHIPASIAEEMDRVLEEPRYARMDEPLAGPSLAAPILGQAIAPPGIVR